jgi:hypothetical protein
MYIDDVNIASVGGSATLGSADVKIGYGPAGYFNGFLSEAIIWSPRSLSSGDVDIIWNTGHYFDLMTVPLGTCSGEYNTSCTGVYNESCAGDNSYCSGTYYTYLCNGTYGGTCSEAPYCQGSATGCSSFTVSGYSACVAQAGCSWAQEPSGYFDGKVSMVNIPTSPSGLSTGDIWINSGVLNIV